VPVSVKVGGRLDVDPKINAHPNILFFNLHLRQAELTVLGYDSVAKEK